jgi:hypothetical protein
MNKSKGHVEFIGSHEFYKLPDGRLLRAEIAKPIGDDGRRPGQFVTTGSGVELALRLARIQAGQSEFR